MCGIIGYTGAREALEILLGGLGTLAYRGYDSAGVALAEAVGLRRCRAAGKLENLKRKLQSEPAFYGRSGIGHTRWATHGAPTEGNAHPHVDAAGQIAVVHNGIIENAEILRHELEARGEIFSSETDTEVIPRLLAWHLRMCGDPILAVRATTACLEGSYALAILFADVPTQIYAVRHRSPLAVTQGEDGCYLASDVTALLSHSDRVYFPPEGELLCLSPDGILCHAEDGSAHPPQLTPVTWRAQALDRAGYRHYMEKELYEVPQAIERTLSAVQDSLALPGTALASLPPETEELLFIGCGSAYHVGLLASVVGETVGIRARAEIASEFRYRHAVLSPHTLAVAISQSGETADTLAALQAAIARGCDSLAVVNVPSSAIARAAAHTLHTLAGPEIAVATTKAYCAQAVAAWGLIAALCAAIGKTGDAERLLFDMTVLSVGCREILASRKYISTFSAPLTAARDIFFIGRGADAAVCREGALKLKEITYLHAEAFDAGELKHGTISLIEHGTPVVAVMTQPEVEKQMLSNIREVMARGAQVIVIAAEDISLPSDLTVYRLPAAPETVSPLLAAYVMQWMAYEVCIRRGMEPDMPRNLAKSVTVE